MKNIIFKNYFHFDEDLMRNKKCIKVKYVEREKDCIINCSFVPQGFKCIREI